MRKTPALLSAVAVAAVLAASLVGCSSSGAAGCAPAYTSGSVSKTVKTTATTASFPTPLVTKTSQVSVNKAGKGGPIQNGDQVDYTYTIYDGKTGESLGSTTSTERSGASSAAKANAIVHSLRCATTGERYTLVSTVKGSFGKGAGGTEYKDSDTLVIVVDVKDHFLGKANGINQLPLDGMPNVITAVSGQPGIVIQELDKPKTLSISTIKAGSGPTVKENDTVHLKYSGWTWPTSSGDKPAIWAGGQTSDGTAVPDGESTWTNDQAADIKVSSTGLPVGMYKSLLGAKVGSQVLVVIPPKDGFGSSSSSYGFADTDTVIMVIDVLGIA
ncbi:MAG TPA: FKBP-type peptidyl-prolyl cis-trans isomerase [Pseudolysinimonas sp.]